MAMNNADFDKPKSIGLVGVPNARELGGYQAEDGRHVKRGVLLRTGMLGKAQDEDIERLLDVFDLRVVVDMRATKEVVESPDPHIVGVDDVHLGILDENGDSSSMIMSLIGHCTTAPDPVRGALEAIEGGLFTTEMYTCLVDSDPMQKAYREFFDVLLAQDEGAVLWHCSGGKDRTGIGAALLLEALGVCWDTILSDYLLTNQYNESRIEYVLAKAKGYTDDPEVLSAVPKLVGVDSIFMTRLWESATEKFGSPMNFIRDGIGLSDSEVTELRSKYLE